MSAYYDVDSLARRLARDGSATTYYQLVNAIDGAFDEAAGHAVTDGERTECEAGRRAALSTARGIFRGEAGADPGAIAEGMRRAVRDSGTPSWHEAADATDQQAYEHIRRVAGLS